MILSIYIFEEVIDTWDMDEKVVPNAYANISIQNSLILF